jgi:hypothetical protein
MNRQAGDVHDQACQISGLEHLPRASSLTRTGRLSISGV